MEKIYTHIFNGAKAGAITGAAIGGLGGGATGAMGSRDFTMSFAAAAVGGVSAGAVGTLIGAGCGLITGIIATIRDEKDKKRRAEKDQIIQCLNREMHSNTQKEGTQSWAA